MSNKEPLEIGEYLIRDPRVCHGSITFKGTRVPVETVLQWMAHGKSLKSVLSDWPELSAKAVGEALRLACDSLVSQYRARRFYEPVHRGRSPRAKRSARTVAKAV